MARSELRSRTRALGVLPLALAILVGCNSLIGLSDYSKVECSGGELCADASLPPLDAALDAAGDSGDGGVVVVPDASGTAPVRWAHFAMPNYPQDGGPGVNVPTYGLTDAGVGAIADSVTHLLWEAAPKTAPMTLDAAQRYCAGLAGGWRLPSRIELVTLLDLSQSPTIAAVFAAGPTAGEYWTSSAVRTPAGPLSPPQEWTVDFNGGGLNQRIATSQAAVRCIKGAN